jgi:hypothetical protein
MDNIIDLSYDGCYGNVDSTLYRTKKSHTWYQVSESSWAGEGSVSSADEMPLEDVAALVMEHCPDDVEDYPELAPYIKDAIDE